MESNYTLLVRHLRQLSSGLQEVRMTFDEIEGILGEKLPPSARSDDAWWGNQKQGTNVESIPWMDAGWMVDTADPVGLWVKFVRQ